MSLDSSPGTDARSADAAGLTVRTAEPSEWAAIGDLTVAGYVADGLITADDPYAAALRDTAARARQATALVAVDGGTILGTVTFCRPGSPQSELARPGEAEFRMLSVSTEHRGRGVGEALVRACVDLAVAAGDSAVVLCIMDVTESPRRLYARLGFERVAERDWQPRPDLWLRAYRVDLAGHARS